MLTSHPMCTTVGQYQLCWGDQECTYIRLTPLSLSPHLSRGTAVHTTLWEVPAVICCICFPCSPWTLAGRVMEPVLCPCPHWPMLLVPHAYTAPSGTIIHVKWIRDTDSATVSAQCEVIETLYTYKLCMYVCHN